MKKCDFFLGFDVFFRNALLCSRISSRASFAVFAFLPHLLAAMFSLWKAEGTMGSCLASYLARFELMITINSNSFYN